MRRKKTRRNKNNNIHGALNITIKRDFVKHKTAKTNDTNLTFRSSHDSIIKKKVARQCKLNYTFKTIFARRINIKGCEDYGNTFRSLRSGFKSLMKSISCAKLGISRGTFQNILNIS